MKEVILKLLCELSNVSEIKNKVYILEMLKGYVSKAPSELIESIVIKTSQLNSKSIQKEVKGLFDEGTHFTVKLLLDIYDQLDDNNKNVVWDYHSTLTSFLVKLKKEQ